MSQSTGNLRGSFSDLAFIDPFGRNLRQVRRLAHQVIEVALAWRAGAGKRSPLPSSFALPIQPRIPASSVDEETILRELKAIVHASANTSTPDYLAHMGAVSSTLSALGDFVASSVNNNLIGLELSPSLSLLEEELCRQFAGFFGLGTKAGGVITTGGSLSNLLALVVARNAILPTLTDGLHGLKSRPVFLVSEASHASIEKSAMIMGLGSAGAIGVKTNSSSQMDMDELEAEYTASLEQGMQPFCVVATAGTTVTGSIDPIEEIGAFARKKGLWYHVDTAWGGGLRFSRTLRDRIRGIEAADSVTFCPQKLLLVALSSSVILFRDMQSMAAHFRTSFPYLQEEERFINRSEIGVQGSRPAEILKLWLTLQHVGAKGFEELIGQWVGLADYVAEEVRKRDFLRLAGPPEAGIVCFRGAPSWAPEEQWDEWSRKLHQRIVDRSGIYLSFVNYRGAHWLRAVFANPYTTQDVVDRIFAVADEFAEESRLNEAGTRKSR